MKYYKVTFTTTAHRGMRLVVRVKAMDSFQATIKAHEILLHRYNYSFQILEINL